MQIFPNGKMYYVTKSSDLDDEGMPVSASDKRSVSMECTITTLSDSKRGKTDGGSYRDCTYSVTFNMEDYEARRDSFPFKFSFAFKGEFADHIALVHDRKGDLGTFMVQRIEFYEITNTIEIWV